MNMAEQAREVIPLYINGSMQGNARKLFEDVLARNAGVRKEYQDFLTIDRAFRALDVNMGIDLNEVLRRVQTHIFLWNNYFNEHEAVDAENRIPAGG